MPANGQERNGSTDAGFAMPIDTTAGSDPLLPLLDPLLGDDPEMWRLEALKDFVVLDPRRKDRLMSYAIELRAQR